MLPVSLSVSEQCHKKAGLLGIGSGKAHAYLLSCRDWLEYLKKMEIKILKSCIIMLSSE